VPIYEYGCQSCGHRLEVIHGVHESGPAACPVCGGPMRKLLSPPAIVFKGSGWAKKERSSSPAKSATTSAGDAKHRGGKSGGDAAAPGKSGGDDRSPGGKASAE
jgi:putative FmdB family regulatory protein